MSHKSSGEKFFIGSLYAALGVVSVVAGVYMVRTFQKITNTVVQLRKVLFRLPALDTWALDFYFDITNKSDVDLMVTGYSLDLKINGEHVSTLANKTSQYIQARSVSDKGVFTDGVSTLEVIALIKPKEVTKSNAIITFLTGLSDYKNMKIDITGYVSVKHSWMVFTNLPVSYSFKLGDMLAGSSAPETKVLEKK